MTNNKWEKILHDECEKYPYAELGRMEDWLKSFIQNLLLSEKKRLVDEIIEIVKLHRLSAWSPTDPELETFSKGSKVTADAILSDLGKLLSK